MGYATVITCILIISLAGIACGETTITSTEYVYRADQSVVGNGFHNYNQKIVSNNLDMRDFGFGSGKYNHESKLSVLNQANNDTTGEYYTTSEQSISFNETTDQVYSPASLGLGKSSLKTGPLSVLGKEGICLKNYENGSTGVSMDALFDSASVLSKDLSANLYWKFIGTGYITDPEEDFSTTQLGITMLNVNATFTGKGHIGAKDIINYNNSRISNRNASLFVDEDYTGTFSISKRLSEEFSLKDKGTIEGWLPCCSAGWDDMTATDKKGFGESAKGIFDCTCYKAPSVAQFTEPEETKAY